MGEEVEGIKVVSDADEGIFTGGGDDSITEDGDWGIESSSLADEVSKSICCECKSKDPSSSTTSSKKSSW